MIKGRSLLYFDLYLSPAIVIRIRYFAVFLLCLIIHFVFLIPDLYLPVRGTVSRDFLLQAFFMNHLSQSALAPFQIFSNIREDIRNSRCTTAAPASITSPENLPQVSTTSVIISFLKIQIATGANDAGGKFASSVNDTGGQQ